MKQLEVLKCLIGRVVEKQDRGFVFLRRWCNADCDGQSLCNEILAVCNSGPYTKAKGENVITSEALQ